MEMTDDNLQLRINRILDVGPNVVMVNRDGYCVSAKRAHAMFAVIPDIVFVREDGWSLGAPLEFEHQARDTWPLLWVARVDLHTGTWDPMS